MKLAIGKEVRLTELMLVPFHNNTLYLYFRYMYVRQDPSVRKARGSLLSTFGAKSLLRQRNLSRRQRFLFEKGVTAENMGW